MEPPFFLYYRIMRVSLNIFLRVRTLRLCPHSVKTRAHSVVDANFVLRKALEYKFRKYEDKLPLGVGLIPLPVTTFGLWEENAAANLLEIVNVQSNNLRDYVVMKRITSDVSSSVFPLHYNVKMVPCYSSVHRSLRLMLMVNFKI